MSNPIPSQVTLATIQNGTTADGSVVQSNDAAIQTALNELIAALSNGVGGNTLQAADGTHVQWVDTTAAEVKGTDLNATGLTGAAAGARLVGGIAGSGPPASGTFALRDIAPDSNGKAWVCTAAGSPGTWLQAGLRKPITALTYGATVTPDASKGDFQTITITNSTAFTIANPANPPAAGDGQRLILEVFNNSGGAHGTITMGAAYALLSSIPAATIANSKRVLLVFYWNGSSWVYLNAPGTGSQY